MTKILTSFKFLLVLSLFTVGVSTGLLLYADAQTDDSDMQCRSGQVLVYHFNFRKYICTSESGAQQWVLHGIAEIVSPVMEEETMEEEAMEEEAMEEKPMEGEPLPAIPKITKAGTIDDATLYDDGATNTWNIVAVSQGDLLDFSTESGSENGLGAVLGVFNGSHIWITGQHETSNQGLKHHDNVNDFQAHTHLVSLRNSPDCTYGFAYEKVHSTDTDNTSIVHDEITDTSTIQYNGIPANLDVGDIVDKSLVCHAEDNGNDVGEYYVWQFYKGNNGALCINFDTARSQDKLISQDAETGGFICPE